MPPNVSASRPVTSAWRMLRWRKMGRRVPKAKYSATTKTPSNPTATPVSMGLIRSMITNARLAESNPPASSTMPVPIRFRMPSTSDMMRETSAPVLVASKKAIRNRMTWRCTFSRISAIRRCAALDRSCVSENDVVAWIAVAAVTNKTRGRSNRVCFSTITLSMTNLVEAGGAGARARAPPVGRDRERGGELGLLGLGRWGSWHGHALEFTRPPILPGRAGRSRRIGPLGFEPRLPDPKSGVLPLDEGPLIGPNLTSDATDQGRGKRESGKLETSPHFRPRSSLSAGHRSHQSEIPACQPLLRCLSAWLLPIDPNQRAPRAGPAHPQRPPFRQALKGRLEVGVDAEDHRLEIIPSQPADAAPRRQRVRVQHDRPPPRLV